MATARAKRWRVERLEDTRSSVRNRRIVAGTGAALAAARHRLGMGPDRRWLWVLDRDLTPPRHQSCWQRADHNSAAWHTTPRRAGGRLHRACAATSGAPGRDVAAARLRLRDQPTTSLSVLSSVHRQDRAAKPYPLDSRFNRLTVDQSLLVPLGSRKRRRTIIRYVSKREVE